MTPVVLLFGQSNGANLFWGGNLHDALTDAQSDAQILNASVGGSSVARLDGGWNIVTGDGDDTPGSAYTDMLSDLDALFQSTPDAYIAGAIWVQGETDAYAGADVDYYTPARTLFEALYEHLGTEVPTLTVGLSDYHNLPAAGVEAVNAQQMALANDLDAVSFVDSNDILEKYGLSQSEAMSDDLHYTQTFLNHLADELVAHPDMQEGLGLSVPEPAVILPPAIEDMSPQNEAASDPDPASVAPAPEPVLAEPAPAPEPEPEPQPVQAAAAPEDQTPEPEPTPQPAPMQAAQDDTPAAPEPVVLQDPEPQDTAPQNLEPQVFEAVQDTPPQSEPLEAPDPAIVAPEPEPTLVPEPEPEPEQVLAAVSAPEAPPALEAPEETPAPPEDPVLTRAPAEPEAAQTAPENDAEQAEKVLAAEETKDPTENMDSAGPSGLILGLSALGAAFGMFFMPILGILGLMAMSKKDEDEDSLTQVTEASEFSALLEDVVPITEVLAEGTHDAHAMYDDGEVDPLLL